MLFSKVCHKGYNWAWVAVFSQFHGLHLHRLSLDSVTWFLHSWDPSFKPRIRALFAMKRAFVQMSPVSSFVSSSSSSPPLFLITGPRHHPFLVFSCAGYVFTSSVTATSNAFSTCCATVITTLLIHQNDFGLFRIRLMYSIKKKLTCFRHHCDTWSSEMTEQIVFNIISNVSVMYTDLDQIK